MTLRCYCCGEPYERGRYRCCAAPPGTSSQRWLERHCKACVPDNELKLRSHCPKHCTCPKAPVRSGVDGFSAFLDSELLEQIGRRKNLTLVVSQ